MRAAVYDTSGPTRGVLRLEDVPTPDPGPGQVRVRIEVAGVNPTDIIARRRGAQAGSTPQIPGQDGAGIIDDVGSGVRADRIGERVWLYHAALEGSGGTAAEYTCVPEHRAVRLPGSTTFEQGAGLGIPGITAHRCLFADGPVRGETVLVTGGAGAVGNLTIQLASSAGARVLSTVSSEAKAILAEGAGAEVVLRYTEPELEARLRAAAPHGIDRVIDVALAENLATYTDALAPHASVIAYARGQHDRVEVEMHPLLRRNATLRFVHVYGLSREQLDGAVADLTEALEAGALTALPTEGFPLNRIADAHDLVEHGVTGKVLLEIS